LLAVDLDRNREGADKKIELLEERMQKIETLSNANRNRVEELERGKATKT
jgi:hypothetical protein